MAERCETAVYIIATSHCDEPVAPCKIGISGNPATRLSILQVASPKKLKLFHSFRLPTTNTARKIEHEFHRAQCGCRLQGEWFKISPEQAFLIICSQVRSLLKTADDWKPWEITAAKSRLILHDSTRCY